MSRPLRAVASEARLPKLKSKAVQEQEITDNRNKIVSIRQEMEDIYLQQRHIKSELDRLDGVSPDSLEFRHLNQLKKDRKKLENNVQLLNNRIELLKKEEQRFWKKIRELHNVASEIETLKKLNDRRKKEKEEAKHQTQQLSTTRGHSSLQSKSEQQKRKALLKALREAELKKRAEEIKKESLQNEKIYRKTANQIVHSNMMKKAQVARKESEAALFRKLYAEEKKRGVADRLRRQVSGEKFIIKKYKKDLEALGRTEAELIGKLRNSQQIESQAFDKLKKVLDIKEEPTEPHIHIDPEEASAAKHTGKQEGLRKEDIESQSNKDSLSEKELSVE